MPRIATLPVDRTLGPGSSTTTEMKVDLPVPLRPTRATFSPAPTTKEASRSRVRSPISMVSEEPTIIPVIPRRRAGRRPTAGWGRRLASSQPAGRRTGRGPLVWPRATRMASTGNGQRGSSPSSRPSTSPRVEAWPSARRTAGPTGNPARYQPACLRNCRMPRSAPKAAQQQVDVVGASWSRPRPGRRGGEARARRRRRPGRGTATVGRGSRGPTTTPSHPVVLHHGQRVGSPPRYRRCPARGWW